MDAVAQALADPIRREILVMLHEAPRTAGAIAEAFTVSRPAISRHLRVLREAGLVRDTVSAPASVAVHARPRRPPSRFEAFLAQLRGPKRLETPPRCARDRGFNTAFGDGAKPA